jgi:hypothetical protein
MAFQARDRGVTGVCISGGIELEAETPAQPAITVRTEVRPRFRQGEINVEENCAQLGACASRQAKPAFAAR